MPTRPAASVKLDHYPPSGRSSAVKAAAAE